MSMLKLLDRKFKIISKKIRLLTFELQMKCNYSKYTPPLKVIFYGTDNVSEPTLQALHSESVSSTSDKIVEHLDVICLKSDSIVRRYAQTNHLTIFDWPHHPPHGFYDVGVCVSFGRMIPTKDIMACNYGIINGHPSLLPRWRGSAPIIYSLLHGDVESGVTIVEVSPDKFDVGKILLQEKIIIPDDCSLKNLIDILGKLIAKLVMETLRNLSFYKEHSYPQSSEGVTYAPKIKPEQARIKWSQESSVEIYRKYKAFDGLLDLYSYWDDKKIGLLELIKLEEVEEANLSQLLGDTPTFPGFCYFHKKRKILFVKCKDGWCGITSLRVPKTGKRSVVEFYCGFIQKRKNHFNEDKQHDINR